MPPGGRTPTRKAGDNRNEKVRLLMQAFARASIRIGIASLCTHSCLHESLCLFLVRTRTRAQEHPLHLIPCWHYHYHTDNFSFSLILSLSLSKPKMVSCSPGMTPRSSTGGNAKRASWGGGGGSGREAVAEDGSDRVIGALHLNFNSSFSSLDNHLSKLSGIRQHFEGNGKHTRIQMHTRVGMDVHVIN
jgi:hypothetical protein